MKLIKFYLPLFLMALIVASCGGNKKQETSPEVMLVPPHLEFTASDTSAIRTLAEEYIAAFKEKDYEYAASMLRALHNDSIVELSDAERQQFLKTMRQLPNYGVKLKGFSLYTETNNRLIYLLQVVSSGHLDTEEGIMRMYLNPVRRDGQWYLTIFDPEAEGTREIF